MHREALFVSGRGGYFRYRIPALAVTGDGTVLAFCEGRRTNGRDDDEIDLLLRRSTDGGVTWGPVQKVASDGDHTCGNPCVVVDRETGVVFLLWCRDCQDVLVCHSDDAGRTWSEHTDMTAEARPFERCYVGTGPGHGIQLRGGRLLVPCWVDEPEGPVTWRDPPPNWGPVQSSYCVYSDNHGATWRCGERLAHNKSDECEAVELSDGRVYMTLRARPLPGRRGFATSDDGGRTWSDVQLDSAVADPDCQGSIVRYEGRRVLLANLDGTERRANLTIRLSEDECASWSASRVLEPSWAAYSDLAVTEDRTVLCLYESGEAYDELVLARFDLDWLSRH